MDLDRLARSVTVDVRPLERLAHARDLWPRSTLAMARGLMPIAPDAVAFPTSDEEISACLEWAAAEGVAVVPWGAGSGVCGAAAGAPGTLTLDLKRMNRIGPVDRDAATVRVGPGVLGQHLEDHLEAQGWATRHSPSSIWCSTVGGWAASRSAGQFSSRYGKFEDMVHAARVAAPTANFGIGAWAGAPPVPGYPADLGPWVLGSEGALGVLTELSVKVVPFPETRWLRGYRFATLEGAWEAMRRLLQSDLRPAVLRLYDPVDTRLAGKGTVQHPPAAAGRTWLRELQHEASVSAALRKHLLSLPLALPRLVNRLAQRLASGAVMIAGWEGGQASVDIHARHGHALLLGAGGEDLGHEPGEHWYRARHEVSYKMAPIFEAGGFADTMEVAALWSRLPALFDGVRRAIGQHAIVMSHFSHVYAEGCSIYFSFAGAGDLAVYDALWRDALAAAAAAGGTVAHHHGVGQLKRDAAARELGAAGPMFRELKRTLDPHNVLNPGRMLPELPFAEPEAPSVGIDRTSRVATLPAWQPAAERDLYLADAGFCLRFPTTEPLAAGLGAPRESWDVRVLGMSARSPFGRVVALPVPRSSAGPDLREALPAEQLETLTVPIVPAAEPVTRVRASAATTLHAGVPVSLRQGEDIFLRGPAAPELAALLTSYPGAAR